MAASNALVFTEFYNLLEDISIEGTPLPLPHLCRRIRDILDRLYVRDAKKMTEQCKTLWEPEERLTPIADECNTFWTPEEPTTSSQEPDTQDKNTVSTFQFNYV